MKLRPVNIIPFKLHNIGDFLNRSHPNLVPDTEPYERYWVEQAKRSIEGLWGHDFHKGEGGYRYMPGNLYFHTNMSIIEQEGDYGSTIKAPPVLRDLDWYIFYGLAACDGFAGFEYDRNFSCFRPLHKLEMGLGLSHGEKHLLEKYHDFIVKPDGNYKKYIDARTYLYQTFQDPLGNPLYLNEAQDFLWLASRRTGKSYDINNGVITYDFTFNGARTLADFMEERTKAVVVVGSADSVKSSELLSKFSTSYDYLRTDVGAYSNSGYSENGAFWRKTEGSLSPTNTLTNRVSLKGGAGYAGPGSQIVHVNFKHSASAAVGFGARRIVVEEVGLLENVEAVHYENNATQRRETKYGYTIYIGTGGDMHSIKGVRNMFYNPDSYGILPYPDVFKNNGKNIGCFVPVYYRFIKFVDENGNTDINKAFEDEMMEREAKKAGSSRKYHGHVLSFPFVPDEIFMQSSGGLFHVEQLEKRILELESGSWEEKAQVGTLRYIDTKQRRCIFEPDLSNKLKPIIKLGDERDLAGSGNVVDGGLVIYEHPSEASDAFYLILYDPVEKDDVIELSSVNAIIVFKFWDILNPKKMQFNVVAEWFGRYDKLDKNHEMAFRLADYYKAKILVETNKKDFLRYAEMTMRWDYLEDTPNLALTGKFSRSKWSSKGIEVRPGMKPDLETYLYEVCDTVVSTEESISGDKFIQYEKKMVEQIPSIRVCEELLNYNRDGNYDAVSALFLLGVYVRELNIQPTRNKNIEEKKKESENLKRFILNYNKVPVGGPGFNW